MSYKEHGKFSRVPSLNFMQNRGPSRLVHQLKSRISELEERCEESRRMELKYRSSSAYYHDFFERSPLGYFVMNYKGTIFEVNALGASLLRQSPKDLIGKSLSDFVVEDELPKFLQHLKEAFITMRPVRCELERSGKFTQKMFFEIDSLVSQDEHDGGLIIRAQLRDITTRKLHEIKLQEECAKAESASRAKSKFLANMSHEMRTPLGVIIGFTDLLIESIGPEAEQQQGLKTIHRNGFHLLSLIDDLLDLAKIEADQMSMENLVISLSEELQIIMAQFAPKANDKALDLKLTCAADLPDKICTDPIRFRQIVLNILSNALKFTEHGSVSIHAFTEDTGSSGGRTLLNIDIKDSGCGIPSELQHLLFRPFAQAEESTSRLFGGTGLGLFLSKRLAEALGGGLYLLRSESGQGSTFRISIDPRLELCQQKSMEDHEQNHASPPPLPSLKGIRVLVVEDGIDNQVLIRKLLEMAGAEVDCADDGEKAVDIATNKDFDVVLMDIQMPLMDGYTAATQIRSRGCQTPIVALTAHALIEDRMKAEQFGFDGFLSKPIDWFKLAGTIVRCRNKPNFDIL